MSPGVQDGQQYLIVLEPVPHSEGVSWIARVPDLPGCGSAGSTPEEAARNLKEAIEVWLDVNRDRGFPAPEPRTYSGRFTVRVPASLHQALDEQAQAEQVSLSQYVSFLLSQPVAQRPLATPATIAAPQPAMGQAETTVIVINANVSGSYPLSADIGALGAMALGTMQTGNSPFRLALHNNANTRFLPQSHGSPEVDSCPLTFTEWVRNG